MINDQSVLQGIPDNVTISDLSKYIVRTNRNYDLPIIVSAYEFAFQAHGDQKRSSGEPYIVHPLSVAWILVSLGMDTECVCAGLLHDVVEDTDWTMEDLRAAGFPETILEAVQLLTHDPAVPYLDYVRALCGNPIAVAVKRADLHHNSERTRFDADSPDIEKRLQKYAAARAVLDEAEKEKSSEFKRNS